MIVQLKYLTRLTAVFMLIPLLFWIAQPTAQSQAYGNTQMETITYPSQDLNQLERTAEGLYLSEVISAPFAFNALVVAWPAETGTGMGFYLEVRTGKNDQWGGWTPLHTDHDLTQPEDDQQIGQMILVTAVEMTHDQLQFRAYSHDRHLPSLQLTFIDSTHGPTSDELRQRQAQGEFETLTAPDAVPSGYPKPAVIPRTAWCTDYGCFCPPSGCGNACLDNDPLAYHNVTHLIVHHTVSNNDNADWAAVMRAIWNFHAMGLCWGDIGYNYLVDLHGLIYEGHRGGDDVVGTHSGAANNYSMGVSLLGTFTDANHTSPGIRPPEPMLNSLAEILAWKASQKNIDIYGASYQAGLRSGRPHLMGHRDTYGTTECPGEQAHQLLPEIKNRVATKLNFTPDHIYIDELSSQFSRGGFGWQVGEPYSCGNNSHSYFVRGRNNSAEATAWGEWRFNVPHAGRYEVEIYTPFCRTNETETTGARYTVYHAGGQNGVTVNQDSRLGLYTSLGTFDLSPNSDHRLRLTNWTTDDNQHVWFDTIRLRYLGPAVVNNNPADESWQTGRTITFQWGVSNAPDVGQTRLRIATDAGLNNIVHEATFNDGRTSANHTFGQDYAHLYWQVSVNTAVGTIHSTPSRFGLDSTPPTTAVDSLSWNPERTGYLVGWSGTDNLSGLQSYRIEYRLIGQTTWSVLFDSTTQTSANVIPSSLDNRYEFRSLGRDNAGNIEPAHETPDISTDILGSLTLIAPSPGTWVRTHAVELVWEALHDTTVLVQVARDEQFNQILVAQTVPAGQEWLTVNVGADYAQLFWRIIEPERVGQVVNSSSFGVDTTPPTTAITQIFKPARGGYVLVLAGQDALSGLDSYALQFRQVGATVWQNYAGGIQGENVSFRPDDNTAVYQFRVRGTDKAGNIAPWSDDNIRSTTDAILLHEASFLPIINR